MEYLLAPLKLYLARLVQSRLSDYFENIELDGRLTALEMHRVDHCAPFRGTVSPSYAAPIGRPPS